LFNPADHPEGAINFLFVDPPVLPGDPAEDSNGSRFFFLHTDALFFAETPASLGGPNDTLAELQHLRPAIPEPSSVLLGAGPGGHRSGWEAPKSSEPRVERSSRVLVRSIRGPCVPEVSSAC
jgi:hypothetical protein